MMTDDIEYHKVIYDALLILEGKIETKYGNKGKAWATHGWVLFLYERMVQATGWH